MRILDRYLAGAVIGGTLLAMAVLLPLLGFFLLADELDQVGVASYGFLDALIVMVGDQRFAVPLPAVHEVIEVPPRAVTVHDEEEMLCHRGKVLALVRLSNLFGIEEHVQRASYALIVGRETRLLAMGVDRILGQREIVVRAIADPLIRIPGIAAATELGDGKPILILDAEALTRVKRDA